MTDEQQRERKRWRGVWGLVAVCVVIVVAVVADMRLFPRRVPHRVGATREDLAELVVAIIQYQAQYLQLPGPPGKDVRVGPETPKEYDQLIEVLSASDVDGDGQALGNPRRLEFLTLSNPRYSFVDAWGRRFVVYLDLDNDGVLMVGSTKVQARYACYSVGENGKDEYGGGDDIVSWQAK